MVGDLQFKISFGSEVIVITVTIIAMSIFLKFSHLMIFRVY